MRRWAIVCLSLAASALLVLAVLPWCLGPILHGVGKHFGVHFSNYERVGYGRFRLNEVRYEQPDVRVLVDHIEVDSPLLLVLRHWRHDQQEVKIGTWRVDALEASRPAPVATGRPHGAAATQQLIGRIARSLEKWIPRAEIGPGVVTWPGDQIALGGALLRPLRLEARPLRYQKISANADFTFSPEGKISVELRDAGNAGWTGRADWAGREMAGQVLLWGQKAEWSARWVEDGWRVENGKIVARDWSIPAEKVRLSSAFTSISATAEAIWNEGKFSATAEARATPSKGRAPPVLARLRATGNPNSVRVEEFLVNVPGIDVQLTAPWEINPRSAQPPVASQLTFSLDLAQQKFFAAQGKIAGVAVLTPNGHDWPALDATFSAAELKVESFALAAARGAAHLRWPILKVENVVLQFNEGGELQAEASWDFSAHALAGGKIGGTIRPALLAPWLPPGVKFETVAIAATAAGTWPDMQHSGTIMAAKVVVPKVSPLTATIAWEGVGAKIKFSSLNLAAGGSRVTAAADLSGDILRIEKLDVTNSRKEKLTLESPVEIRWRAPFSITALALRNATTEVKCDYRAGASGRVNFSLENFSPEWVQDFYAGLGNNWQARHFDLEAKWDGGPWDFRTNGNVEITLAEQRAAILDLAAHGEKEGLVVEKLHVSEGAVAVMDITGKLPLVVESRGGPHLTFRPNDALEFHARTSDNPQFWQRVQNLTGVELEAPQLTADVSGSWREPTGTVEMKAEKISLERLKLKFAVPRITGLAASLRASRREIAIEKFSAQIEGQAVAVSGELPLREEQWDEFRQAPWKFFQGSGHVRVQIPDADVAPLARYFPGTLAPSGKIHLDAELKPGGTATGILQVSGVVARSFGPFGVLQDIQADVRFEGKDAKIVRASARAGGQEMRMTGEVGLPIGVPLRLNLALDGHDIPIVRETGLLVRADVALRLSTNARRISEISGDVNLRDSIFLSDVRAFLPSGGGGPSRRPPYFSVESPLLSNWRLAVNVRGDHFLRLRSTVFVGVASARFRLDGTLGQPHAVGELAVDSGDVLLPFATFAVQQGSVRLTDADPFNLGLSVTATSRRYGYDLRMDVDGTAANPRVVFSSSPPLEARQVLLMVTAGEVPNDTIAYGTTQRVARLGTYLGQSLLTSFGGDSGKADRLSISTGERVSLQGRETYDIEYKLNNRYTLVGEYDEFDDYNVGVKYRLGKIPSPKPPKLIAPSPPPQDVPSAPVP